VSNNGAEPLQRRPEGCDDATVEAAGKLGEALEWLERARGRLYDFHQMMGRVDFLIDDAAAAFASAGHDAIARELRDEIVGRNVLQGRWTFQVVEEFDDDYYDAFREAERSIRERLLAGRRHVYESELKERRRTRGRAHHEAVPS
jgi:hypothetical protein